MTLNTVASRASYPGAGVAGPFAFPFRVFAATDLSVIKKSSVGAETPLAYVTDFTVSGVGDVAGSVTLNTVLAAGEELTIRRAPPLTQPTSIRNQGAYFPATIEDELDRLVMQIQALDDRARRSFGVTETYDPSLLLLTLKPETGKVLGWDSPTLLANKTLDSSAIALPGAGRGTATVSAFLANNAVFNIKDYLGVGNGAANDTVPAQNTAAAAIAAGGLMYLPEAGVTGWKITAAIPVNGPLTVWGAGRSKSVIFCSGCDGFTIAAATAFVTIGNMSIAQAVRYTTTPNAFVGIRNLGTTANQNYRHTYRDLWIDGFLTGIIADGVCSSLFDNVETGNGKNGLSAGKQTLNNVITSSRFSGPGAVAGSVGIQIGDGGVADPEGWMINNVLTFAFANGVWFLSAAYSTVANSILDYNSTFGVLLQSGANAIVGANVLNNYVGMTGLAGDTAIYCVNAVAAAARQNFGHQIRGNIVLTYVGSTCTNGILVGGAQDDYHTIDGNRIWATTWDCRINTGTHHSITNNKWRNNGYLGGPTNLYDNNDGPIGSAATTLMQSNGPNRFFYDTAAPVAGTFQRGDIFWHVSPSSGGFVGWVCTIAGTPGTWKTFGLIS